MRSVWTAMILVWFVIIAGFQMTLALTVEVQHVQLNSTVTMGCDISYLYDTTWFKQNLQSNLTPTVVLCGSLREGRPVEECQFSDRFSVRLVNRSLALTIVDIEEEDLGLYYCIATVNSRFTVGKGTVLQGKQISSAGGPSFLLNHQYCMAFGSVLLILLIAVCVIYCKNRLTRDATAHDDIYQNDPYPKRRK